MKKSFYIAIIASIITLSSCEKVIDIDLNNAEKKYVIEGNITDLAGSKVVISQTIDYDQDNNFPRISGAVVSITESGGTTTVLTETSAGVYDAPALNGIPGKTYTLTVNISGQLFSAVCKMPLKVNLDSIYVTDELLFGETQKIVNTDFIDPPGLGNSYRFFQTVNGNKEKIIIIRNDEYADNKKVTTQLFYFDDEDDNDSTKIKSGDNIEVELQCIDPVMYKYWYSMYRSALGNSGQATPANPVSNMPEGALGYFSAHTTQTKTMIVP